VNATQALTRHAHDRHTQLAQELRAAHVVQNNGDNGGPRRQQRQDHERLRGMNEAAEHHGQGSDVPTRHTSGKH
jgi:hypothetical protein